MTGSSIAGTGYKIEPTLHVAVGIFNCPGGIRGKESGRFGGGKCKYTEMQSVYARA